MTLLPIRAHWGQVIALEGYRMAKVDELVFQVAELLIPVVAAEIERRIGQHETAFHPAYSAPPESPRLRVVTTDDYVEESPEDYFWKLDQAQGQ